MYRSLTSFSPLNDKSITILCDTCKKGKHNWSDASIEPLVTIRRPLLADQPHFRMNLPVIMKHNRKMWCHCLTRLLGRVSRITEIMRCRSTHNIEWDATASRASSIEYPASQRSRRNTDAEVCRTPKWDCTAWRASSIEYPASQRSRPNTDAGVHVGDEGQQSAISSFPQLSVQVRPGKMWRAWVAQALVPT